MVPTKEMYDVVHQQNRVVHVRVELLSKITGYDGYTTISEITGKAVGGTLSADANSDIRRNCNIDMIIKKSEYESVDTTYWIDKRVAIYVGITSNSINDIVWFKKGTYIFNQPSITYSADTYQFSFQGVDLMAMLTGLRGGVLGEAETQFKIGQNIRNIMIELIGKQGFTNYIIDIPNKDVLQENVSFDASQTIYDILLYIRDTYYPSYQMYFDEDGVFRFHKIPTGKDDIVVADNTTFKKLAISFTDTTDFESVKNVIEIFGRTHEPDYSGTVIDLDDSVYVVHSEGLEGISDFNDVLIGIDINLLVDDTPLIKINDSPVLPVVDAKGALVTISKQGYYIFQKRSNSYLFVGDLQAYAKVSDINNDSPFSVGNIGELRLVLSGGEYDLITTNELALDRAKYELYNHDRLNDSVLISSVPILYLEVYDLIEFKIANGETRKYMVQNISTPLDATPQTINASRFYPDYTII